MCLFYSPQNSRGVGGHSNEALHLSFRCARRRWRPVRWNARVDLALREQTLSSGAYVCNIVTHSGMEALMSPVVRISDETYEKLQALAKPFVDTPDSIISRLADAGLSGAAISSAGSSLSKPETPLKELDPDSPGSLTHTKLRSARFGDEAIQKPNWNKLSRTAHSRAMTVMPSLDALRHISAANIRTGRYEGEGFAYIADADISVQGQDSSQAWECSYAIAKELGFPIEVVVEWYNKEGAAYPGEQRRIAWEPK